MAKHGPDEGWRQHVLNNVLPRMEATTESATSFTPGTFSDTLPRDQSNWAYTDPAQWLPPAAAERLRRLQQDFEDKRNLLPSFEERKEASDTKRTAERRLQQLTAHPQESGFGLPDDHPSVVVAKRQLDQATAAQKRIDDLHTERSAALQAASGALSSVTAWLKDGRPAGTVLEAVELEPPKLQKGETVVDAIERLRRRGREMRADLHRVASAPFPSSFCKKRIVETVGALAARGAPDVSTLIEHNGEVGWPQQRLTAKLFDAERSALAFAEPVDALALFAWTFKDVLVAKLAAEIDVEADDDAALSIEAREKAEAELLEDLLDIERQEADLIFSAQREGLPVEHRADVSPLALLGVRLITTAPAAVLPGTSPEFATVIRPGRR